jgi:hypothetical protein
MFGVPPIVLKIIGVVTPIVKEAAKMAADGRISKAELAIFIEARLDKAAEIGEEERRELARAFAGILLDAAKKAT